MMGSLVVEGVLQLLKPIAILLTLLWVLPAPGAAQTPTSATAPQDSAPASTAPTTDVFDLLRRLRHKQPDPVAEVWDYRKPMKAFSPVIGSKPSSGALLGVAGNVAFYRGDPATTQFRRWSPASRSRPKDRPR